MTQEKDLTTASSITDSDFLRTIDATDNSEKILASTLKTYIEDGTITELNKSRGFDRLTPDDMGVPSYDVPNRKFSMAVKGGQTYFEFWADGNRFEKTVTQEKVWPDVTGKYYFYFDTSGDLQYVLSSDMTYEIFCSSAICGLVYWNATTGEAINQAIDEQHGIGMPAPTHFRLHMRTGAVHAQGGDITGLEDGEPDYTNISTVFSMDEDINIITTTTTTTPFIYREGGSGDFVQTATPDLLLGYKVGGTGDVQYNKNTAGVWSLEDSSGYVIYYFYWTNDANNPIKKFVGNEDYSSRSEAREALKSEVGVIQVTGLPSPEAYPMFAYIVKANGDLEDSGNPSHYTYVDLRYPNYFDAIEE